MDIGRAAGRRAEALQPRSGVRRESRWTKLRVDNPRGAEQDRPAVKAAPGRLRHGKGAAERRADRASGRNLALACAQGFAAAAQAAVPGRLSKLDDMRIGTRRRVGGVEERAEYQCEAEEEPP